MKQMFLLFSHTLTQAQIDDAKKSFGVKSFITLPNKLQNLWSNIPAELDSLDNYLQPLKKYIEKNSKDNDIVLIQGDFGAVYKMVNFCKSLKLIPIYSTTTRKTKEIKKANKIIKTSIFEHCIYRKY